MIKLVGGAAETSNENTEIVLSLQDITGQLDEFLDSHHSTELMRVMCPPAALYTRRGSNLAFPNYAPLPSPKINQLVIPTGASRWSYGLFLATEQQKNTIYECQRSRGNMTLYMGAPVIGDDVNVGSSTWTWNGSSWDLSSDDCKVGSAVPPSTSGSSVGEVRTGSCSVSGGITAEVASEVVRTYKIPVHCLPPRPVTPRGRLKQDWSVSKKGVSRRIENTADGTYPKASDLYIIPVVDIRYFWQYLHTGAMSAEDFSSDAGPFTNADFSNDGNRTSAEKLFLYLWNRFPSSLNGDGTNPLIGIDDLHPYYQTPPKFVSGNDYENLAVVFDSFLWMHGLQLVPYVFNDWHVQYEFSYGASQRPYGVVSVQESDLIYRGFLSGDYGAVNGLIGLGQVGRNTGSGARTILSYGGGTLHASIPKLIAGGDNYRFVNGSTTILEGKPFPAKLWVALGDGTFSEESIHASFTTHGAYSSLAKSVSQTAAVCRYEWDGAISNEQLDQIVYDWYMRYYRQFDMTFAGIQLWQQSCYDDYMVMSMARCKGGYQCQTRVVSISLNHQADVCGDAQPPRKRVAIIDGLAAPTSSTGAPTTCVCAVLKRNVTTGQLETTDERITVTNFSIGLTVADGTYGKAEYDGGVWELYWVDCGPSTGLTGLNPVPETGIGGP